MSIKIYNSLTREKEEFKPLVDNEVNIYTCGVTVYDESHIGHARSLYIFDVIRRYFKYRGYKVKFIRNITDIDDKIINKANELGKTAKEVAEEYIKSYKRDIKALGIDEADKEPRATENIPEMIKHIDGLIKKDYAYVVDGDVYFSVKKFKDYGKLSGQSIEQMIEAVRIEKDHKKKDPLDFALWKKSQEDEPFWESPWGKGRPGWHIECSVMSSKYLGETFDIHAGGRDLIFPHHENEIAQSEALTGKTFARYWIHHGLLTINGQKMAKSLGNFVTIQEVLKRYPSDILKIFYLQAHYSSPIDFSWEKMEEATNAIQRFEEIQQRIIEIIDKAVKLNETSKNIDFIEQNRNKFFEAMDDDFNTPRALSCLFDLITDTNKFIDSEKESNSYYAVINTASSTIFNLAREIFGLSVIGGMRGLPGDIEMLIHRREEYRASKKFKEADEIREKLERMGIIIKDTKDGKTTWRRKI